MFIEFSIILGIYLSIADSLMFECIVELANSHLKDWLKKNNHDDNLHLRLRNKHSFPSIFAIYHDKTELIQIDLVNKWYGIILGHSDAPKFVED